MVLTCGIRKGFSDIRLTLLEEENRSLQSGDWIVMAEKCTKTFKILTDKVPEVHNIGE